MGFEALYWLPWLAKLRAELDIDPARLIPITRGGAACWYGVPKALELYEMRTPQDVRIENHIRQAQTGFVKQYRVSHFDRQIYADAAETLGLRHYDVLHPSWMYKTLDPFWTAQRGLSWLFDRIIWTPLPVPPLPEGLVLPDGFLVMRFYFRNTFPKTPKTVEFAEAVVKQVSQGQPVILLNTGLHADDHTDFLPRTRPDHVRLLSDLYPGLTVQNNLAIQSAVIARAEGFVGTYGGLAQLGLRYGKPSVTFFTEWGGTALAHRQLSEAMALQMGKPFQAIRLAEIPALQAIVPQVRIVDPTKPEPVVA